MATHATQNKDAFIKFLDSHNLEWDFIGLWEIRIMPTRHQLAGIASLLETFDGRLSFIGYRKYNVGVWIVELPRIIIDFD